jgi:hypothetical protein
MFDRNHASQLSEIFSYFKKSHNLWSKTIGNGSELFMPKLRQSKSFASNIVLFMMADIVLDCHLR